MFVSLDMIHDFNYFFSFKIKGDKHRMIIFEMIVIILKAFTIYFSVES